MKKESYLTLAILLFLSGCDNDISCSTCNNFSDAFVIGFDPCTGVGDPNGGEVGFIISIPMRGDTVVAYNFPNGIYEFPVEYFSYYQFYCLFPDSAWNDFPVNIKYRYVSEAEKTFIICKADIYTYYFNKYVQGREVKILSITK